MSALRHASRRPECTQVAKAEFYAAASATSETLLIREVLLFMGLEVRTELFLDSAAARGICRREGVGTTRHFSTKVLWLQQLVRRGVVMVGACTSAENCADMGTKSLPLVGRSEHLGWMPGAMCEVTDTLAEDSWRGAQWDTGRWLQSWSHKCVSGRLVHGCWQTRSFC